jgi:hypothetical protein
MTIRSASLAILLLLLPTATIANPEDLYTQVGTDPTPTELLANGSIVFGESFSRLARSR